MKKELLKLAKKQDNFIVRDRDFVLMLTNCETGKGEVINPDMMNINFPYIDVVTQYISPKSLHTLFFNTARYGDPVKNIDGMNNINMRLYGILQEILCGDSYITASLLHVNNGLLCEIIEFEENSKNQGIGFLVFNINHCWLGGVNFVDKFMSGAAGKIWENVCCANLFSLKCGMRVITEPYTTNAFIEKALKSKT